MSYLYTIKRPANRSNQSGALGDLEASTLVSKTGEIDVVEKFPWTLSQSSPAALKQTPYIRLKEYYLLDGALNQLLKAYNKSIDPAADITIDNLLNFGSLLVPGGIISELENNLAYENLYDHTNETGFSYKLPYFENPQNTQNNWTARSSYTQMIELQKVLAEVQANVDYLNAPFIAAGAQGITAEDYIKGYEELLTKFPPSGGALNILIREGLGKLAERSMLPTVLPGAGGGPMTSGELAQRTRKAMIDFNVLQVDLDRTIEQLKIALKSATGNIGEDPVLDKPHIWSSSQPRVFNITFPLYNTNPFADNNVEKSICYNWELCYLLTYQNLYNKRNLFNGIPPVFYEVSVPGVYYTKAAYVSNITILNVGNIRNMALPIGRSGDNDSANTQASVNVPDAYVINMTLVDFFMPSRNFLETINDESKRTAVSAGGS